jgi:radical SAM protein with 4Fe4S-binding SPASM domain
MLYHQKFDTFIRIFDNRCDSVLGYITSKSDFSDRVVDASGTTFLRALSRKPKTLDTLCREIAENFAGVTPEDIRQDTVDFFAVLEVQTSLYSVEPAIHDAITLLPGSCEKTKKGLIRLIDAGISVSIVCPVMKQNKDIYSDVLRWAQSLGVHSGSDTHILARSDRSTGNLENRISIDEDIGVISSILENDPDAYNHKRFSPDYHNPGGAFPCIQDLCKSSLCVNSVGDVLPNPAWYNVLGNLHTQTLRDIWENSAKIKRLRSIGLRDFPKCRTCPDIQFCGMSLVGNANENPNGDIFTIPEHICEHARRERKLVWTWWKARKDQQGETNALSPKI